MAIEPGSKSINDFHKYYKKIVFAAFAAFTLILAIIIGVTLQLSQVATITEITFWLIIVIYLAISTIAGLILIKIVTTPTCQILLALSHKNGELINQKPPNPNSGSNKETGFNTVLTTIYGNGGGDPQKQNEDSSTSFLIRALNYSSASVVILNKNQQVIFASASAPIAQDANGMHYLALDFLGEINISDWLNDINNRSIRAEKVWRRIPVQAGVTKKDKFYDIVASYEKGDTDEMTVIFLFDKSDQYLPEEEDLNFIAFAAHELRGPITVIRGYLDIISHEFADRLKGDEKQLMDRLIVSANRLSSYIGNILNVSKFDRHHLEAHLLEDKVSDIYASIADDMSLRAATSNRLLNINIPADLPTVAADRSSIGEVLANLIDNAIKYSFEGGLIQVSAEKKGDFIEISVADNGIGMPPNVVNNLFHKFYRSHRSREAVAGTGIGLYICKAFVESHGGSISARSKENEGSIFSFTIPIYDTIKDKLLEDGQLNSKLIRTGSGWIKNHSMYRD